jgi:hypothetical protein
VDKLLSNGTSLVKPNVESILDRLDDKSRDVKEFKMCADFLFSLELDCTSMQGSSHHPNDEIKLDLLNEMSMDRRVGITLPKPLASMFF